MSLFWCIKAFEIHAYDRFAKSSWEMYVMTKLCVDFTFSHTKINSSSNSIFPATFWSSLMFSRCIKAAWDRVCKQTVETNSVFSGSKNLGQSQAIRGVADSLNSKNSTWQWLKSSRKLSLFLNSRTWTPSAFLNSHQTLHPLIFLACSPSSISPGQKEKGAGCRHFLAQTSMPVS